MGARRTLGQAIDVLGVRVFPADVSSLHTLIHSIVSQNGHSLILNVNVHCLNLAYENRWLKDFLNSVDAVYCDGAGVQLAAWLLGYPIPARVTFADWIWDLTRMCEESNYSLSFLGGRPGVAERAAQEIMKQSPGVRIVGVHQGYFDKRHGSRENERVIATINERKPNILIVGFGMPTQEAWLRDHWDRVQANVALTAGALFDYVSGDLRRAPRWMTSNGLEWLGRLLIEPHRLWRRYLIGNPLFLWRVLRHRAQSSPRSYNDPQA